MQLHSQKDLTPLNTLAVPSIASYFCNASSKAEVYEAYEWARTQGLPVFILGGGSNVILATHVNGVVLTPAIMGREVIKQNTKHCWVKLGAGENWHEAVSWCVQNNFYGLENLALIPGSVGAAPVQNIGAYGVELEQVFESLSALNTNTGEVEVFNKPDCAFAYRDSIFKKQTYSHYVILDVTLKLNIEASVNCAYPALEQSLKDIDQPTPMDVFYAVCNIRRSKLPTPTAIPNCGSFFKNPIVSLDNYQQLLQKFPSLVAFDVNDKQKKLAAAWLIDHAGWKGKMRKGVGVHSEQALVLVNPNGLEAKRVLALAYEIRANIKKLFNVELELEPRLVGFLEP